MDKENLIIKPFLNELNGDDGAVLKMLGKWCFSKDLFFEDVHFKRGWLSYEQIATKSLLVNISDAIVMNAVPKYALLGLALPKDLSNSDIKALQRGFLKTARDFKIKIIGGDTISADKIALSITLISKVRKKAIYRQGLKKGDLLAFTGSLGESLRGLKILQEDENSQDDINSKDLRLDTLQDNENSLNSKALSLENLQNDMSLKDLNSKNSQASLNLKKIQAKISSNIDLKDRKNSHNSTKLPPTHRFIRPSLRSEFFYKIASKVSCAMDLSDGLGQDLARMLSLNKLGVKWLVNLSEDELNSGEEYEILFAFAPKHKEFMLKNAKKFDIKLTIFGKAKPIKKQEDKYKFKGKSWHFE